MFLFRTCNTITVGDGCVGVGEKEKIPFVHISSIRSLLTQNSLQFLSFESIAKLEWNIKILFK